MYNKGDNLLYLLELTNGSIMGYIDEDEPNERKLKLFSLVEEYANNYLTDKEYTFYVNGKISSIKEEKVRMNLLYA